MRPESQTVRVGACLSLSGRYAPFGRQAAAGLEAWRRLRGGVELSIEDDGSDPARVRAGVRELARRSDLLLGPYSTSLARAASEAAAELGRVLWNHGGAGDDVQAMAPGNLISVLTPAGRYGESFVRRLAGLPEPAPLWIVAGRGSFGRQVAGGAQAGAARLGIEVVRSTQAGYLSQVKGAAHDLLCAGSFEEDVELLSRLERRPRTTWAVAAGVRRFGSALDAPGGVYGPAQWLPGTTPRPDVGPPEQGFLREYAEVAGEPPDYPAAQAAATAALATHCLELAGTSTAPDLWRAAAGLDAITFYGRFRVDHRSGAQLGHEVVLVRWAQDRRLGPA